MKLRLLISVLFYSTGCLFLGCQVFSPYVSEIPPLDEEESVNLALRQTAHNLYFIQGDSTSRIPPVSKESNNKYSIKVEQRIRYDTMPVLLNQAILDYKIKNDYHVTISSCEKKEILLGYNLLSFENRQIPCLSREHQALCNIITLTLKKAQTSSGIFGYLSVLMVFIGFVSHLYPKLSLKEDVPSKLDPQQSFEVLHLGGSDFTPTNLLLVTNGDEKILTFREGKLLELFFRNPNQVLNRDDIQDQVWGEEGVIVGRSIDVFVSRLRKILKENEKLNIKTVHGIGYRLEVNS